MPILVPGEVGFLFVVFVTLVAMILLFGCMSDSMFSEIFLVLETLSTLIAVEYCVNFAVLFKMVPFTKTFITLTASV